jgi:aryl-alcohol dehydrogenase-like predicted oxidoreductase
LSARCASEQVVGRALENLEERPYVFTKSSLLEGPGGKVVHGLERDSILGEAEASLERLGIGAIDLYQIHWSIPDEDIEEGWAAMELKEQGLVRHIGVSNFSLEQLGRIQQIAPVETLQPQYSLVDRDAEDDVLPFAARAGIGVIAIVGFRSPDQVDPILAAAGLELTDADVATIEGRN